MSDDSLTAHVFDKRSNSLTLFSSGGRGSWEEEEGAAPLHDHQEGGREEKEQKRQPNQGPLPWRSWSFHLAVRLPVRVGQGSVSECMACALCASAPVPSS